MKKDSEKKQKNIKAIVIYFLAIPMAKMWKRYFQIGNGIILLLGAPVKSTFDGLKSREHSFS